jgi:hypothetical protein
MCSVRIPRSVRVISTPQQAAEAVRRTRPDRVVPVHWRTCWPAGLPEKADLIDLPAAAFAAQVVRIAPATSVHVLRSSSSVGRALLDMPWESVLGRQQRSRSPHEPKACAPTNAAPWRFVPATCPCWPLDEHAEFGRLRVRRDRYEPDVVRGRILSMGEDNGLHDG